MTSAANDRHHKVTPALCPDIPLSRSWLTWPLKLLTTHVDEVDPAAAEILRKEKARQKHFINLIPSENFTSQAVLDMLGSVMQSMSLTMEIAIMVEPAATSSRCFSLI